MEQLSQQVILDVRDVELVYANPYDKDKKVAALKDLNLRVFENELVSIIGPSGCGKSTLLNLIAGFFKPERGSIYYRGKEINGISSQRGMIFQEFFLFPWKTVIGNIQTGLKYKNISKELRNEITDRLCKMVGLSGFERSYPYELSGGMKQRVAFARALAMEPDILLMDEPFGSLDAQTRLIMGEELTNFWAKMEKTMLLVTHDVSEAIFLADRVFVMTRSPGKIKEVIEVNLPRPREWITLSKERYFNDLVMHCLATVKEEVILEKEAARYAYQKVNR